MSSPVRIAPLPPEGTSVRAASTSRVNAETGRVGGAAAASFIGREAAAPPAATDARSVWGNFVDGFMEPCARGVATRVGRAAGSLVGRGIHAGVEFVRDGVASQLPQVQMGLDFLTPHRPPQDTPAFRSELRRFRDTVNRQLQSIAGTLPEDIAREVCETAQQDFFAREDVRRILADPNLFPDPAYRDRANFWSAIAMPDEVNPGLETEYQRREQQLKELVVASRICDLSLNLLESSSTDREAITATVSTILGNLVVVVGDGVTASAPFSTSAGNAAAGGLLQAIARDRESFRAATERASPRDRSEAEVRNTFMYTFKAFGLQAGWNFVKWLVGSPSGFPDFAAVSSRLRARSESRAIQEDPGALQKALQIALRTELNQSEDISGFSRFFAKFSTYVIFPIISIFVSYASERIYDDIRNAIDSMRAPPTPGALPVAPLNWIARGFYAVAAGNRHVDPHRVDGHRADYNSRAEGIIHVLETNRGILRGASSWKELCRRFGDVMVDRYLLRANIMRTVTQAQDALDRWTRSSSLSWRTVRSLIALPLTVALFLGKNLCVRPVEWCCNKIFTALVSAVLRQQNTVHKTCISFYTSLGAGPDSDYTTPFATVFVSLVNDLSRLVDTPTVGTTLWQQTGHIRPSVTTRNAVQEVLTSLFSALDSADSTQSLPTAIGRIFGISSPALQQRIAACLTDVVCRIYIFAGRDDTLFVNGLDALVGALQEKLFNPATPQILASQTVARQHNSAREAQQQLKILLQRLLHLWGAGIDDNPGIRAHTAWVTGHNDGTEERQRAGETFPQILERWTAMLAHIADADPSTTAQQLETVRQLETELRDLLRNQFSNELATIDNSTPADLTRNYFQNLEPIITYLRDYTRALTQISHQMVLAAESPETSVAIQGRLVEVQHACVNLLTWLYHLPLIAQGGPERLTALQLLERDIQQARDLLADLDRELLRIRNPEGGHTVDPLLANFVDNLHAFVAFTLTNLLLQLSSLKAARTAHADLLALAPTLGNLPEARRQETMRQISELLRQIFPGTTATQQDAYIQAEAELTRIVQHNRTNSLRRDFQNALARINDAIDVRAAEVANRARTAHGDITRHIGTLESRLGDRVTSTSVDRNLFATAGHALNEAAAATRSLSPPDLVHVAVVDLPGAGQVLDTIEPLLTATVDRTISFVTERTTLQALTTTVVSGLTEHFGRTSAPVA